MVSVRKRRREAFYNRRVRRQSHAPGWEDMDCKSRYHRRKFAQDYIPERHLGKVRVALLASW